MQNYIPRNPGFIKYKDPCFKVFFHCFGPLIEFYGSCHMVSQPVAAPGVPTGDSAEGVSDGPVTLSGAVVKDTGARGR